jgi:uncharacterized Fe-S cluster-containing protein
MDHFAGLDVSVKDTSVCIVDGTGKIVREVKVVETSARVWLLRIVGASTAPTFMANTCRWRN